MERVASPRPGHPPAWLGLAAAALLALAAGASQAQGSGQLLLRPAAEGPDAQRSPTELAILRAAIRPAPVRLFGDYFFFDGAATPGGGGLRASSGLISAPRPWSLFDAQSDAPLNQPYLGLGYSKLWLNSQLSLNADFGLASQNPGGISRMRNILSGPQTLDDTVRDLRWAPVMAVHVSYAF